MRIYEATDFEHLLSLLPALAGNEAVHNELLTMMAEQKVVRQPWTFEVDFSTQNGNAQQAGAFAAPAAGAVVNGSFNVDSSAPFMLVSGSYHCDIAGAAVSVANRPYPHNTVFITDQSGNRNWMNVAVPITALFGPDGQPFYWAQPRLIPANTNIAVVLANFEQANTNNIRLSFHGWRYYALGQ